METPIFDYLIKYAQSETLRLHMPGHKGISHVPEMKNACALDITEITGADSLFEAEGIISQSEKTATRLFRTEETVYSCGGSTLCIQGMLYLMKQEGRRVIAARTVHRAFLSACALLGIEVTWVYPEREEGILSGEYTPECFEKALSECRDPACVYVTATDYLGHIVDIAGVSRVCKRYGAPLLADNAHGAHLAFTVPSRHPIHLGADLCCDSAHKMLPCLTGCAYLHTSNPVYAGRLKQAMSMFASTSPSYLMLASLDICNVFLEGRACESTEKICRGAEKLRERLGERFIFSETGDPLHIAIDTASMSIDGRELGRELEAMGCYPEYAGREAVVLLLSAAEPEENLILAETVLGSCEMPPMAESVKNPPAFPRPVRAMSIRDASLAMSEAVSVKDAVGRICAAVHVPCPPAVPIVISGEVIDSAVVAVMEYYGISDVLVVKEA